MLAGHRHLEAEAKAELAAAELSTRRACAEAEAEAIQDLYLAGKKMEATMMVPDRLVDEVCLVGPAGAISDRLEAWKESGVGTLIVGSSDPTTLEVIASAVL